MTKKEFQDRTGYNIPDELYNRVEQMYMNAGQSIDKDTFCADYKKHSESVLMNACS